MKLIYDLLPITNHSGKLWEEFINNPKYIEYFKDNHTIWMEQLEIDFSSQLSWIKKIQETINTHKMEIEKLKRKEELLN